MPVLPGGRSFGISRDALFDHGGNWFGCPKGHFWYWIPDPEWATPPFSLDEPGLQIAVHAPVPKTRGDVKHFIRVLEMKADGTYGWRGEWLSSFPEYTELDPSDMAAWRAWINRPAVDQFLDDTIACCERLAQVSESARGMAGFTAVKPS